MLRSGQSPGSFLDFSLFFVYNRYIHSLLRRPLGHWFDSNLCYILAGMLLLVLIYAAYLYVSSKKGVVHMLISSVLYMLTCLGTNSVAQKVEQVAS